MLISLYLFYQLNPQISILSPQPMPFQSCQLNPTVLQPWKCSHFAQKQKIRELRVRPKLSEIPLFQGFFTYYFSTLDINATNSTWLERTVLMSFEPSVLGNKSTAFFHSRYWGTYRLESFYFKPLSIAS